MSSRRPDRGKTGRDHPDNHAIIDKIYAIACDPELYEDLIDAWSQRVNDEPDAGAAEIFRAHAVRATALLERLSPIDSRSSLERLIGDLQRPGLACLENGRVLYSNPPLDAQLSTVAPRTISDLDLAEASVLSLSEHLSARAGSRHVLLQLETRAGQPISTSMSPAGTALGQPVYLVVFYDFIWNSMLENLLADAFGLTASERAVVQGFAAGLSTSQIARQRGRSEETVRTQLKTIMAKTGTRSQLELLRLLFGFTALAEHSAPMNLSIDAMAMGGRRTPAGMTSFLTHSGRRYDVHVAGAQSHHLCLHLHSSMGLYLLSEKARQAASEGGLRLWSVIRPGYGASGPLPPRSQYRKAVVDDLLELIERSGASRVSLLLEGVAFRLGVALVKRLGQCCRGITVVSPVLRMAAANADQHEQKWHRIVLQTAVRSPALLPFFVRAGFAYARAIGSFRFLEEIYGKSPIDLKALADGTVMPLLQAASRVTLTDAPYAHSAFADGLLDSVDDWLQELAHLPCPVTVYYGRGDNTFTARHVERLLAVNGGLQTRELADAGHLAILTHGERIIAELADRDRA